MGIFKNLLSASFGIKKEPIERTITFDSNWVDSWESLRLDFERTSENYQVSVNFDLDLLRDLWRSIEEHRAVGSWSFSEDMQAINNVGESFRQTELSEFCQGRSGEDLGWIAGFLLPELANPVDKTAVAIYAIRLSDTGIDSASPFNIVHAGYMDKESAKKVHKKLLNLMGKNSFVPLLVSIHGGIPGKPNYGVFVNAKTSILKFP